MLKTDMLKKLYYKLPSIYQNYLNKAASKLANNAEEEFIHNDIGKNYNLSSKDKANIVKRIRNSLSKIDSATSIDVHLELGKRLLDLPNNQGSIVECGCYQGASTVSLSIFSKIVERNLIIYDSFEGLPEDKDNVGKRNYPFLNLTGEYKKGMYKSSLENVKNNLKFYGEYDVCELRKGYFDKSLIQHKEKIDFLFLDVDLVQSTTDCIKYLWKFVNNGSYIYTDDACDMDVVKFWFDKEWWNKNFDCDPPNYVGSGCGINLGNNYSSLGFTIKNPDKSKFNKALFLY